MQLSPVTAIENLAVYARPLESDRKRKIKERILVLGKVGGAFVVGIGETSIGLIERLKEGRRLSILTHPPIAAGGALFLLILLAAVFAPWLGTVDPTALDPAYRLLPPSTEHFFGTDGLGRDVYSRVIYGGRVSLLVGFSVAILTTLIGILIGLIAGFIRPFDMLLMRFLDGFMSIPSLLLAIALVTLYRGSMWIVIVAITATEVPRMSRLVRGNVLSLREQTFVEGAIAAGSSSTRIALVHVLPNALPPVIVQATFVLANAMITESVLSFIGAGTPPSIPSWGNIIAESRALWQIRPNTIFFPAIFLSATILAVNLLGDGLRDIFDTRAKGLTVASP